MAYVDTERLLPNWAALLCRVLLLLSRAQGADASGELRAREIFKSRFADNELMQKLAWGEPAPVPPAWLVDVVAHPSASSALLRVLSRYRDLEAEELSDIIEHVLLAEFLKWDHCQTILASELMNELLGACMDAGKKANLGANVAVQERRCPEHWAGQHCLWRLEYLGRRLFHVAFVFQEGFLPHSFNSFSAASGSAASDAKLLQRKMAIEDDVCSPQPQVVEVSGSCLWDEGLLTIELLQRTMMEGRAMLDKPILHYGRHVIMRHLWYKHVEYCEVPKLKLLWDLACWPLCEDAGLVRQALEYLKGTYRDLCRPNGPWSPEHEEDLFQMFLAIDLSLLPISVLHSPWVPAQVQSVRLLVQQQPADQFHQELQQEITRVMEHLKSVNFQCSKLNDKLNVVEQRTVMNKSQISDASATLEERQRKRQAKMPWRSLQEIKKGSEVCQLICRLAAFLQQWFQNMREKRWSHAPMTSRVQSNSSQQCLPVPHHFRQHRLPVPWIMHLDMGKGPPKRQEDQINVPGNPVVWSLGPLVLGSFAFMVWVVLFLSIRIN